VERVLVVGNGYAGRRFTAALSHLARCGVPLELVGICDRDQSRARHDHLPAFIDTAGALALTEPSVVCVTVNESQHGNVYESLADSPPLLVLTEKPLGESEADAELAAEALKNHLVSMNMVERFSPIVRVCREWLEENRPWDIVRIESFWGKHRLFDARPTMGVLSELIHPIDLVEALFAQGPLEIEWVHGTASDFSPRFASMLDSVDVLARGGDTPVVLHSSFVWPKRLRTVVAVLRHPDGRTSRVELTFDDPHWDCDKLEISSIDGSGRIGPVLAFSTDVDDLPEAVRGVGKVATFMDQSIRAWRGEATEDALVDLAGGVALQATLSSVETTMGEAVLGAGYRTERVR
jgi:predicted dehydrogenase